MYPDQEFGLHDVYWMHGQDIEAFACVPLKARWKCFEYDNIDVALVFMPVLALRALFTYLNG